MASWQAWKAHFCTALFVGVVSTQAAYAVPVLSITATPDPAVQGSPLALNVLMTGIADLYAYQFTLSFNPALLRATSVIEGAFLATGGTTYFDGGTINNTTGTVSYVFDSLIGAIPGVSGNGVLDRINFSAIGTGTSALTFSNVLFLDSTGTDIAVTVQNRTLAVSAVPEPATLAMLGIGLAGLAALRSRKAA